MDQSFVRHFILFVFVSINGQTNITSAQERPELSVALRFNKYRIDIATGLPDYGFRNYIFIKGFVWDLKLTSNTLDGYEVKVVGIDPNSDSKLGYSIGLYKNETVLTFEGCALIDFNASDGTVNLISINIVSDYKKVDVIRFNFTANRLNGQLAPTSKGPPRMYGFFTQFHSRPQVGFYMNVTAKEYAFIETTVVGGKYKNRFVYDNGNNIKLIDDSRPDLLKGLPKGVLLVAKDYYIRGVFPAELDDSSRTKIYKVRGYILLIQLCTTHDLPCTGQTSYHYCFVEPNETTPTADGNRCNANQLKDLFGSTSSATAMSDETPIPTSDVPLITTSMSSKLHQTIGKLWWLLIVIIINIV